MLLELDGKQFEEDEEAFKNSIFLMLERENERYLIIALSYMNKARILRRIFATEDELMQKVHEYASLGYKVHYKNNDRYFI